MAKNIILRDGCVLLRYQKWREPSYSPALHEVLHAREFCMNPSSDVPLAVFTDVFSKLWRRFAESGMANVDYAIFDATLVSHMTNDLIRNYNAPAEAIAAHLETLVGTVRHLRPIVFYLSADDVRERLISARQNRGQAPLDEAKIRFWKRRKEMDLAVLPRISVASHMMDISAADWGFVIPAMLCILNEAETNAEGDNA